MKKRKPKPSIHYQTPDMNINRLDYLNHYRAWCPAIAPVAFHSFHAPVPFASFVSQGPNFSSFPSLTRSVDD
jgi:hypothetical protein